MTVELTISTTLLGRDVSGVVTFFPGAYFPPDFEEAAIVQADLRDEETEEPVTFLTEEAYEILLSASKEAYEKIPKDLPLKEDGEALF